MDSKNYNFRLAEEMVKSTEEDLKDIFNKRSNQIYKKLNNILKIFKDEKFQQIISTYPLEVDMAISQEKRLMMYLLNFFLQKNQLLECNL